MSDPRTPSGRLDTRRRSVSDDIDSAHAPIIFRAAHTDPGVVDDAQAYVKAVLNLPEGAQSGDLEINQALRLAIFKFSKNSETAHLEAIALAYSIYIHISSTQDIALLKNLSYKVERKIAPESTIRIIVENIINYGSSYGIERKKAERLYSRDKRAIEYLLHTGIHPSNIAIKAKTKGEGLDQWARKMSKINALKKQKTTTEVFANDHTNDNDDVIEVCYIDHSSGNIIEHIVANNNEKSRKLIASTMKMLNSMLKSLEIEE